MKTRNSHGLLQLGREALAYCQCASALISGNKALFVSVDLIGGKNQVILESELIPCFRKWFARKKYGCRFQWYKTFNVSFNLLKHANTIRVAVTVTDLQVLFYCQEPLPLTDCIFLRARDISLARNDPSMVLSRNRNPLSRNGIGTYNLKADLLSYKLPQYLF